MLTQASVALFQTRGPLRYAPTRIWRAMKFKVLLRKRGGVRARARRAPRAERESVTSLPGRGRSPPANIEGGRLAGRRVVFLCLSRSGSWKLGITKNPNPTLPTNQAHGGFEVLLHLLGARIAQPESLSRHTGAHLDRSRSHVHRAQGGARSTRPRPMAPAQRPTKILRLRTPGR